MAKLFEKRRAELPTGAVLIHVNRFEDKPWNVIVQRQKHGEAYVNAIDAVINDDQMKATLKDNELRAIHVDYIDDDTAEFDEATGQYQGETLSKFTEATLLLFYGRGDEFLEDVKATQQLYNNTEMTVFVFKYPISQDKQENPVVADVKVKRYNNEDITNEKIKPPKHTFKAPHDSADFKHLTYLGLTQIAWQPKKASADKAVAPAPKSLLPRTSH